MAHGHAEVLTERLGARQARSRQIEFDVVGNEEVDPSIVVVIEECAPATKAITSKSWV